MVRHTVLMQWTDQATVEQTRAVVQALQALPARIPEIRQYTVGTDLGRSEGNFDLQVVGDFDSFEDFVTYRDHPDHQRVVVDLIRPILTNRAAVQAEFGE